MSFYGVIDSDKNKVIWTKTILSLASISEHIKFTISINDISLSAINPARTSHAEIQFKNTFFKEYIVNFTHILNEGFEKEVDSEDRNLSTYSFLINSKHLALLFRNLDASELEYICFKIYWDKNVHPKFRYCLLIEIKTKQLIVKKYQTGYQPVARNRLLIANDYNDALYLQKQGAQTIEGERIHHIIIENLILKQFLDMIQSSIEDFKIEMKHEKISFTGYTQQVIKDKEYLKQPMSITITLSLEELVESNIHIDSGYAIDKCINFRLKDFKNFINLLSSLKTTSTSENNDEYLHLGTIENETNFEIFFKSQGYPILFEYKGNPDILIQYVQITSENNNSPMNEYSDNNSSSLKRKREESKLPGHKLCKTPTEINETMSSNKSSNMMSPKSKKSILEKFTKTKKPVSTKDIELDSRPHLSSDADRDHVGYQRDITPDFSFISRQNKMSSNADISSKRIIINQEDNTDYSNSEDERGMDSIDDDLLGPTQTNEKPKSIFND